VFVCDEALPPPPEFPITMPTSAATTPTRTTCHVRQDRRSLIFSDPGAGAPDGEEVEEAVHDDPESTTAWIGVSDSSATS
jgi:hypothetical protein